MPRLHSEVTKSTTKDSHAKPKVLVWVRRQETKGGSMNLNQGKVAQGLVDELLILIHCYDESLYVSTVIGCLELVKQQLINESLEDNDATQD